MKKLKSLSLLTVLALSLLLTSCNDTITVITEDGRLYEVTDTKGYSRLSDTLVITSVVERPDVYIRSVYKGVVPPERTIGNYTFVHFKATVVKF